MRRYQPEFIWNTNWQQQLELEESLQRSREKALAAPEEVPEGFLSFTRLSDLNDMNVDLSAQLRPREKPSSGPASTSKRANAMGSEFSRKDAVKLQRVSRSVARGATMQLGPSSLPEEQAAELARIAAEEAAKYEQLKIDFQVGMHARMLPLWGHLCWPPVQFRE